MVTLKSKRSGFTLVELMIVMLLSLSLLASLLYSVLGDMRTYGSTSSSLELSTKGRMSTQLLRLYIQQAGFRDFNQVKANDQIPISSMGGINLIEGQKLFGWNQITSAPSGVINPKLDSDILAIRFLGATEGIFSCDGSAVTGTLVAFGLFLFINTNNELICQDSSGSFALGQGVEYLRLLYGMNDEYRALGNNSFKYYNANEVTVAGAWEYVDRIKVGILVAQDVTSNSLVNSRTYSLLDRSITISATNDTRFRNVVSETILIRNK